MLRISATYAIPKWSLRARCKFTGLDVYPPSRIPYCEGLGWAKDFVLELLNRFRHVLLVRKVIRSIIKQMLCTWKQEANVEAKGVDLGKGLCPCLNLVNTTWNYHEITGIVVWHM